ncbi:DUF4279 domain-containing protein [Saccharibacillus endophyticus]|uniref:DUF4279 domain-containing protein n=1 Tax=Saccharibacillus endophyticus TaxID=2060666 RepID=A0ABQ2A576_9BACL|nr:DUF4279 domain-containing protein [Saccharibacillus endophyticus]GGH84739.1 hypothetical protein GCM10007362_40510 [Saccharibacillus endophyticus]
MERTNVKVEFSIFGEQFDPKILTQTLLITPTRTWFKGDPIRRDLVRKETCWELSTDYEESLDINDQINKVKALIQDQKDKVVQLIKQNNLECKFEVVINIENNIKPAMYLNKDTIKFIYDLGAEIDFDLYLYS